MIHVECVLHGVGVILTRQHINFGGLDAVVDPANQFKPVGEAHDQRQRKLSPGILVTLQLRIAGSEASDSASTIPVRAALPASVA